METLSREYRDLQSQSEATESQISMYVVGYGMVWCTYCKVKVFRFSYFIRISKEYRAIIQEKDEELTRANASLFTLRERVDYLERFVSNVIKYSIKCSQTTPQ